MRSTLKQALIILFLGLSPYTAMAEDIMIETFEANPESRWRFFTDSVMGGVSSGQIAFLEEESRSFARMTGRVRTENNGGFIQMRTELPDAASAAATGVRLVVRGNDQKYFIHLRTSGTVLPWQYYQAGFEVTGNWTEVRLPFTDFQRSGRLLRTTPAAESLKSIAVVAYGRDHEAEVDVRELGFY
ncbi:MAG: CIA30 family protein [Dinoroseobacter sp.]|nr:CIA30 family protein [Dinoroseobacter sp.]